MENWQNYRDWGKVVYSGDGRGIKLDKQLSRLLRNYDLIISIKGLAEFINKYLLSFLDILQYKL